MVRRLSGAWLMSANSQQPSVNARLQAHRWLTAVIKDGRSVNELLARESVSQITIDQPAFAKQLLFGSLRFYHEIKAILDQLLQKPLKQKDTDIWTILLLGIYQLRYLSVPDHAALSECVELTRKIKKPWASGLVNATLRNFQRQQSDIEQKLQKAKTYQYSHPNWIINQLSEDWGEQQAGQILQQNNQQAPMTIRVNSLHCSRNSYQQELLDNDLKSREHPLVTDGLVLEQACDVFQLPNFELGHVTVQDAAAQLAVELLDLKPGQRVLDGCAAPGGKTTHILQREPSVELTSVEMSENRLARIEQTLARFGFSSNLKCADILDLEAWWDGQYFDRILVDVPCSATGVIRRNPDIKIHRKKTDIANLVELQGKILDRMWRLLKPGGRLVYATCSVFKQENELQVRKFMEKNACEIYHLARLESSKLNDCASVGQQIFPGEYQMDGFYLCALVKPV